MNPPGLVPTLQEDGFSLFESNAILRYLCNGQAPGSDWYPAAARARAEVDAWLDMQQTDLNGAAWAGVHRPGAHAAGEARPCRDRRGGGGRGQGLGDGEHEALRPRLHLRRETDDRRHGVRTARASLVRAAGGSPRFAGAARLVPTGC